MKLHLDIPNQFFQSRYQDHEDVHMAYSMIIASAMRLGMNVELIRARPPHAKRVQPKVPGEIRYAYHASSLGPDTYCLKASALPHLWFFDRGGYSGWSEIATNTSLHDRAANFDLDRAEALIACFRSETVEANHSKLHQSEEALEDNIAGLRDFVFLPLQVDSDRVLEHLPWEQSETLDRIAELASQRQRMVVIKRHPLCDSQSIDRRLAQLSKHPYVHISTRSVHKLIPGARAVLVANSGVGVEALLHSKPVFAMAASEYAHMTIPIPTIEAIALAFDMPPKPQSERIRRQLGHLLGAYLVDTRDPAAVETRIREHIAACTVAEDQQDSPQKQQDILPDPTLDNLLTRAGHALADKVELMLICGPPEPGRALDQWVYILARAAALDVKQTLILKRGTPAVWLKAAQILFQNHSFKQADVFAKATMNESGLTGQALFVRSRVALAQNNRSGSLAMLRAAADCDDATEQIFVSLSQRLLSIGDASSLDEARRAAQQARVISPESIQADVMLARISHAQGDTEQARYWATQAWSKDPNHAARRSLPSEVIAHVVGGCGSERH